MRKLGKFLVVIGMMVLAGCGSSPPTEFYTLDNNIPPTTVVAPPNVMPIVIGQISIPRVLDRPQIVRQISPEQVEITEFARWAAPLDALIRQSLTTDMEALLPPGHLIRASGAPSDTKVGVLNIDIDRFSSDMSGNVTFDVSWNVTSGNPATSMIHRSEHVATAASGPGIAAMADAMSQAIATLATRIAESLPRK